MAQIVGGDLWIHFEGRTFVYENPKKSEFGKKSGGKARDGVLSSPMPGKITKIFKSVGESVLAGDALIVMEAMKMEYTLKADIDGTIKTLDCVLGDQVKLGKELLTIEKGTSS
jgi:biotin carboxyl carrier protein